MAKREITEADWESVTKEVLLTLDKGYALDKEIDKTAGEISDLTQRYDKLVTASEAVRRQLKKLTAKRDGIAKALGKSIGGTDA